MQQKKFTSIIFGFIIILTIISFYSCSKNNISTTDYTVTDVNGNHYRTVQIAGKTWMAEPLRVTRFNDSTMIPNVADSLQWLGLNTPARCYYNNDSNMYATSYGALYNFYAVSSGKLAPKGWHIADTTEWNTLIGTLNKTPNFTGGKDTIVGKYLKEAGFTHWDKSDSGAGTNSTGLTLIPGGDRFYLSNFESIHYNCFLWVNTERNATDAYFQNVNFKNTKINRFYTDKKSGYSVICVKDKN